MSETNTNQTDESGRNINPVLPPVYYGIFQIERKQVGTLIQSEPLIYHCKNQIITTECNIVVAHSEAFKTEKEAIDFIPKLPKPAMYFIQPLYVSI